MRSIPLLFVCKTELAHTDCAHFQHGCAQVCELMARP